MLVLCTCSTQSTAIKDIGEIEQSVVCPLYDRDLYNQWIDADGDCQDTRQEVLNDENLDGQSDSCRIISGSWYAAYSGTTVSDPSGLDIDHFVPLAEAHRSGAGLWNDSIKTAYANDLTDSNTLIAVTASQNRSKGDKDPANWLPSDSSFHSEYVKRWMSIKRKWGLSMDSLELKTIYQVLGADTVDVNWPEIADELTCNGESEISNSSSSSSVPDECSIFCTEGKSKPCGNSCINVNYTCTKPQGSACYR